jgi:hypothetical protein
LYVEPDARGEGAGTALIEAINQVGRAAGGGTIRWITAADNLTAQRVYNRIAAKTTWVTYEKDVRPVMEARCVSCHSAGGIAPFELTTYEQVAAVKDAVALAVKNRTMPPYLAAPGCTEYADDQNLTDEQIAMLQTFASTGAPRGTVTKPAAAGCVTVTFRTTAMAPLTGTPPRPLT